MTPTRIRGIGKALGILLVAPLLSACLPGCSLHLTATEPEYAATYQHGAVAADHEVASRAGADMLRKGGNAVDAAVATSFCLSVVRPESCGIGGGGFMVIHFSDEGLQDQKRRGRDCPRDIALNYREMCPWGIGPDYYEKDPDPSASTHGAKAVGIPGTVAGLLTALDRYGTLDRKTVLAPAILAAEVGFVADKHFVSACQSIMKDFGKHPEWKERFHFVWVRFCREGKVKVGDVITLPEQAAALRLIADQGAAAFYSGDIGRAIAETVRRDGGVLNAEDLGKFQVASVEPLTFQAFDRTFVTMPPPSSGGVAMGEAMGIFERTFRPEELLGAAARAETDASRSARRETQRSSASGETAFARQLFTNFTSSSEAFIHPLVESMKHAFADRAEWMGDPAFVDVPVHRLLSAEYLDARASKFDPKKTLQPGAYGTREGEAVSGRDDHGTSHFSIVDARGNAVACTETINLEFGSCLAVEAFGFLLNDQMDDFTTRRGEPNEFGLKQSDRNLPEAGKRPLSSMTPTIVIDSQGQVDAVAGASGGPRIITGTMQTLLHACIGGAPAWVAVDAYRVHHQWSPDVVKMEQTLFDASNGSGKNDPQYKSIVEFLQERGHIVKGTADVGCVQLIARDPKGGWQAACDPRKGGKPAGY